jgi:uncharacterized protein (TIGR03437 family)
MADRLRKFGPSASIRARGDCAETSLGAAGTSARATAFIWLLALAASVSSANAASANLALQVSAETAPPGGWAQIKISLATPALVGSGRIVMDFDPSVFTAIASPGVFGASGDAYGEATISGLHLDAQFFSPTGGIGRLRGLPVLVISANLASGAQLGKTVAITADESQSQWKDPAGNLYSVSVTPGSVTVGGSLSIRGAYPGGGLLPAGTSVALVGAGFSAATTVSIDGVISSASYSSQQQSMSMTLPAPVDLMGKRIVAKNPDGSEADYYSVLNSMYPIAVQSNGPQGLQPLFPSQAWNVPMTASIGELGGAVAIQNPNTVSVAVRRVTYQNCCGPESIGDDETDTIPPGFWGIYAGHDDSQMVITAPLPIQALQFNVCGAPASGPTCPSPLRVASFAPQVTTSPVNAISWQWQTGSAPPPARTVPFNGDPSMVYTATAATSSGGAWLSVTPQSALDTALTVTADPAGLAPGTYQGAITVTPALGSALTIPATLTVTASEPPPVTASPSSLKFNWVYGAAAPAAQTIAFSTPAGPAPFTAYVNPSQPNLLWLQVTPASGTAAAALTVSVDPTAFGPPQNAIGTFTGSIVINGPNDAITIPVQFTISGLVAYPVSIVFSGQTGTGAQTQSVYLTPNPSAAPSISVATTTGSGWLSAAVKNTAQVDITVNPAGLSQGTYMGVVTINAAGTGSVQVPVTLAVWSAPPALTVTPASLTFVVPVGGLVAQQTFSVTSGGVAVPFTINTTSTGNWLFAVDPNAAPTPAAVTVLAQSPGFAPGEYDGSITVTGPAGAVNVPVTLLVTTGSGVLPSIGSVVNAASQMPGAVAPGEIVTIYGYGVGPSQTAGFTLDSLSNAATMLNGAQVLFDGRPAPLLYGSAGQVNAIVPYEVASQASTAVEVVSSGIKSQAWGVAVTASAPAILTVSGSGAGQGAVLNQDNSVNGASNPAARGSVIQIFATGEGQTSPPGVTGSITQSSNMPVLPVTVTIGGMDCAIQYAGSALGAVAGLLQVNAVVPAGVTPGATVPITLMAGGMRSPDGVTIAVQ